VGAIDEGGVHPSVSEGNSRVRLSVVGIVIVALFSGLFARLWFLQIADSGTAVAETRANRIRVITEPAVRGSILDRNGKVIVQNELVDSLQVRRGLTDEERAVMVPRLAKVLGVRSHSIEKRLDSVRFSPYQPVPILDRVPYEVAVFVKERPELFPKVDVVRRSIRVYPTFEDSLTDEAYGLHLLGYTGAINAKEQKVHADEGYGPEDIIGKDGVEQMFETELRGSPRVRKLEVDSRGRLVREISDKAAVAGNDVQLTVDLEVQRVAEESLQQGMKAAGGLRDTSVKERFATYNPTGGAAVVLDARDGSVVALASAPTFDVRKFTDGIPIDDFNALTDPSSNFPLLDRAIQGQYAPASTWKLITSIAALEQKITDPEEVIQDRGFITIAEQEFQNAKKEPNGSVKLQSAISVSSDVYFYTMGWRMWQKFNKGDKKAGYAIQNVAKRFGFGQATGIGLPNELVGRVPDEKFKKSINADAEDPATRVWLPGDSIITAIGQGDLLVTPMQMATAYAAFANGGTRYAPRLGARILTPGSESILRELPPQQTAKVKLDPKIRAAILPGLIDAASPGGIGTAGRAFSGYGGITVAGKTGTAQVNGKQDTSVFCAIVNPDPTPDSDEAQYVVVVFVEEGGNGGSVSAPIAKRIIQTLNGDPNPPAVRVVPPASD
jgi:penicillin-binding protein 2